MSELWECNFVIHLHNPGNTDTKLKKTPEIQDERKHNFEIGMFNMIPWILPMPISSFLNVRN